MVGNVCLFLKRPTRDVGDPFVHGVRALSGIGKSKRHAFHLETECSTKMETPYSTHMSRTSKLGDSRKGLTGRQYTLPRICPDANQLLPG